MDYRLKVPVPVSVLASWLSLDCSGAQCDVVGVAALDHAGSGFLTFSNSAARPADPGAVLIATRCAGADDAQLLLDSTSPRLDFIRALDRLEREVGFEQRQSPPLIHPTAQLGKGCVIEDDVEIGAYTRIGPNAVIMRGSRIGAHCLIRAGAVIGDEGFGFERDTDGRPLRFVHLGGVRIGDHVEIGNATAVCRGTLGNTVIEDHVKIDNLVHVAHNCLVEENAMIIACAEVSGAVRVGRGAWIGPNACVMQKRHLGDGCLVGIGAVVLKDVAAGSVVVGNPANQLPRRG